MTEEIQNDEEVIDARARVLKLRRIGALDQSRLVLMLGGDVASNGPYMSAFVFPVCSVREIDGESIDIPKNQLQLDALIQRLDDDGINAVTAHFVERSKKKAGLEHTKN